MIVFGGWGAVVSFLGAGLALGATNALFGEGRLLSAVAFLVGCAVAVLGQFLHEEDVSTSVDPATGEAKVVRHRHHVFWIGIRWWGLLLALIGCLGVVTGNG